MAKATLELIAKTDNWTGGLKKAQSALHNFETTNKGLNQALAQHKHVFVDAVRKMGDMESKASTASGRLREMESMFMELGDTYRRMSDRMKADDPGKVVIAQMDKLKTRILETKQSMQQLQGQLSLGGGTGFGAKFMQGLVPGMGMGVGAAGAMMAVRGVQAAMGLAKDAIKYNIQTNMEFEQSNANLSAVLGKTRQQMEMLTEDAKRLGASTLYTANQVTELQTVLARRGFNEDQILQMTHGIANLALATGTDLAQSAELAASTMQAFGMDASQMERIVSVLGVSTTKSALTTEKLGTSLQYVAPTARAAGYSLEDTVAMLGKLVDSGLDASTAGTSLRQIILAMSTENGKLAKSFGRPVRGLQDFYEALEHVSNAEDLLSDASKEVRVTAVPALISLANNTDGIKQLRGELDKTAGKLQEMADKQTATLRGQVTLLTSAWDGFMINLGNSEGTLKSVTKWLQEMVSSWSKAVALGNGAQSAIGVAFGGWDTHEYANDPGEEYLRKFNEYKKSGKFKDDNAINEYIEKEYKKLFEAEKAATDGDIAVLDKYIKERNSYIEYKDMQGRTQKMLGGIYNRQQLVQTVRKYDTNGDLKGLASDDIDGLIEVAARLLGQKQFDDAYYSNISNLAKANITTAVDRNAKNTPDIVNGSTEKFKLGNWRDIPQAGTIADLEWQKSLVQNSMKLMSDPQDYADAKAHLAEIQAQIDAITGKNQPNEIKWEFGSLDHLNQILKDAKEHLSGLKIGSEEWEEALDDVKIASDAVAAAQKLMGDGNPLKEQKADLKATKSAWSDAASAISSVGSAMSAIEDPAAKVVGIVAQAIAQVAAGYGAALAKAGATGDAGGPWGWVAFAATGAAAMVSSIAAIKAATEYHADGGFIGGPRGTDVTPMWGTPGELVLNRAQQNNLAGQLVGSARQQNIVITGKLSGRDILLAADNTNRSRGGSRGYYANVK